MARRSKPTPRERRNSLVDDLLQAVEEEVGELDLATREALRLRFHQAWEAAFR